MTGLLPTMSLLLVLLVGWAQAEHDAPPQCRAEQQAYDRALTMQPKIPPEMSEEEKVGFIKDWKAQRTQVQDQAVAALGRCRMKYQSTP